MKLKNSKVNILHLCEQLNNKLLSIEQICKMKNGLSYEMTITSGNDSVHMKKSKHYTNEAIDIRCRDMVRVSNTVEHIKSFLGADFDVVYEVDHIHIEYDPKNK